jgi:cell volume regulation protein A
VWLCLWPFRFTRKEKFFISWVGLRGAVSIFLAAIPMLSGLPNADLYFNVAFFVVLVSLVVQGWTVTFSAKRLGIALTDPAPEIQRFEIDVPGQLEVEMVGYPIVADSPVLDRNTLPHWIRPVFVVRGGEVLTPEQAGLLQVGDYGYFLAQPTRLARLDRWFAKREAEASPHPGVFTFAGDVPIASVASLYGLTVPEDLRQYTIAEAFEERFEDRVQRGDRIGLGAATLIATAVEGETLTAAALNVVEQDLIDLKPQTITSLLDHPRQLVRRLGGGS